MAWHKIGDSFYSTKEVNAHEDAKLLTFALMDIGIPGAITYFCISPLISYLDSLSFFVVHTTSAKILYIVSGLLVFSIAYAIRKLVVFVAFILLCTGIAGAVLWLFVKWLWT